MTTFLLRVGMPQQVVDDMRTGPHWPGMEAVAPTLAYDSAAMGDHDGGLVPADVLPAGTVPTLVVAGWCTSRARGTTWGPMSSHRPCCRC